MKDVRGELEPSRWRSQESQVQSLAWHWASGSSRINSHQHKVPHDELAATHWRAAAMQTPWNHPSPTCTLTKTIVFIQWNDYGKEILRSGLVGQINSTKFFHNYSATMRQAEKTLLHTELSLGHSHKAIVWLLWQKNGTKALNGSNLNETQAVWRLLLYIPINYFPKISSRHKLVRVT